MLSTRRFRPILFLTGAEFWGSIGLQIAFFAAPLIALAIFNASPMQVALLNLTESAAALVFGLLVARFVDRLSGARSITLSNVLRLFAAVMMAISLMTKPSFPVLYIALFIMGIASLLNEAGINAAILEFVERSNNALNRTNSLLRTAGVLSELGGVGLTGFLATIFTFTATILMACVSFAFAIICALIVLIIPKHKQHTPQAESADNSTDMLQSASSGLKFIWGNSFLRSLSLTSLHFNFFSSIFQAVFVVYCVRVLNFEAWEVSIVGVSAAIGGLLGATFASLKFIEHHARGYYRLAITFPALSIAVMLLAQYSPHRGIAIAVVSLADFFFGLFVVLCVVLFNTAKQQCSPEHMIGDISATERTIALSGEVPGFILGGAIATALSVQWSMLAALIGIALSAIWMRRLDYWPS